MGNLWFYGQIARVSAGHHGLSNPCSLQMPYCLLMDGLAKSGKLMEAKSVFDEMRQKEVKNGMSSWKFKCFSSNFSRNVYYYSDNVVAVFSNILFQIFPVGFQLHALNAYWKLMFDSLLSDIKTSCWLQILKVLIIVVWCLKIVTAISNFCYRAPATKVYVW